MDCEIVLTVGAVEAVREMREAEKDQLAAALRDELCGHRPARRPGHSGARRSVSVKIKVTGSPFDYYARYLASGHLVVYRPLEAEELKALPDHRRVSSGVVVHDILSGGSAIPSGSIRR